MSIVYRLVKGRPLTYEEGDNNLRELSEGLSSANTSITTLTNDISDINGDISTISSAISVINGDIDDVESDIAAINGSSGSSLVGYIQSGTGATARTVQSKLRDSISVKDFGAVGDGTTDDSAAIDAGSAAVSAAGGGELVFPNGQYSFSFAKPPYNVTWSFKGTDITRLQLGGDSSAVRFLRPNLTYVDGPHETDQVQVEHHRVIAKGSNAIGAQFADYAMGVTIEKENWSETSGNPVAGEINGLTIFTRNGAVNGDPVKTGGAAILANLGQTAGSGYTQVLESVNSVFTKGTLATEKQTNLQILGIDERDNLSYGAIFNSLVGSQSAAIRVKGLAASRWGYIIENYIDSTFNFYIDDNGKIRWRVNGVSMSIEQDSSTGALAFKNESGSVIAAATPTYFAALSTTNVQTGTTYTVDASGIDSDLGKTLVLANAATITVTLPNNAPVGFHFEALQRDAGQVTFTAAGGATLQNVDGHTKTKGQYAVVRFRVRLNTGGSAAIWVMDGSTAA
jgi:hypothetical protein